MQRKFSIVILTYNGYEYIHQLLMDILRNFRGVHEVIIVDNGSEDKTVKAGLEYWLSLKVLPLTVSELAINRGFVGGMNYGIKKATGDVIVVVSNDVRIYSGKLKETLENEFNDSEYKLIGASLYTHDTGWNKFGEEIVPYCEGYFLAATKKFWDEVGGFDKRYAPSDFEDVDLSMQAIHKGYDLVQIPKGIVEHLGGKTYGYTEERRNRTTVNRKVFADKWGLHE